MERRENSWWFVFKYERLCKKIVPVASKKFCTNVLYGIMLHYFFSTLLVFGKIAHLFMKNCTYQIAMVIQKYLSSLMNNIESGFSTCPGFLSI